MRSLFSKSLLGRVVGKAPRINLSPRFKRLEGNLVISRLSPNLQAVAEPSQNCFCPWSHFLKHSRKEKLKNMIFKMLTFLNYPVMG